MLTLGNGMASVFYIRGRSRGLSRRLDVRPNAGLRYLSSSPDYKSRRISTEAVQKETCQGGADRCRAGRAGRPRPTCQPAPSSTRCPCRASDGAHSDHTIHALLVDWSPPLLGRAHSSDIHTQLLRTKPWKTQVLAIGVLARRWRSVTPMPPLGPSQLHIVSNPAYTPGYLHQNNS